MSLSNEIKVFAPASCANVSCGFDLLGFALQSPGDEVVLCKRATLGIVIKQITGDQGKLPLDLSKNTATVALKSLLDAYMPDAGVEVIINKKMPLGSGLGSSAASAVAATYAADQLFGFNLDKKKLVEFAMQGEAVASGAIHGDNIAPSMLGGFTLVKSYEPFEVLSLPVLDDLYYAIIHPDYEINTKLARQVIRRSVALKDVITQNANLAGFIAALYTKDYDLLGRSIKDVLIEPDRSLLIPKFDKLKQIALDNGALGFGISGSGPSLFSLSRGIETAQKVADLMAKELNAHFVKNQIYVDKINLTGAVVI